MERPPASCFLASLHQTHRNMIARHSSNVEDACSRSGSSAWFVCQSLRRLEFRARFYQLGLLLLCCLTGALVENGPKRFIPYRRYAALCVIGKNQNLDVREFVEYHRWIGVANIYLYDHNSTEPLMNEVMEHVRSGFVQYTYFNKEHDARAPMIFSETPQGWAYNDCIRRAKLFHKFAGFIDLDEFIILYNDGKRPNITAFLERYEEYGALAMNYVVMGSDGHRTRPSGGVLRNYRTCLQPSHPDNRVVKTFANLDHTRMMSGCPHFVVFLNESTSYSVNERFERVLGEQSKNLARDKIAVYHYKIKSRDEFLGKIGRGRAGGYGEKDNTMWKTITDSAKDTCSYAQQLSELCCSRIF